MGAEGRGYASTMGVVLWWSVLLLVAIGAFTWLGRWAWLTDLASARVLMRASTKAE